MNVRNLILSMFLAFGMLLCSSGLYGQGRGGNEWSSDDQQQPGRPDIRFVNPLNVLPKFKERRHFADNPDNPDNQLGEEFRTYNGVLNNLERAREGSIFVSLMRLSPAAYGPNNSLARQDLPSAREISNAVSNQTNAMPNDRGLSDFIWQWGQFIDHDLDLTEGHHPVEPAPISVPVGDPVFDATSLGGITIGFNRSLHRIRTLQARQQINEITAWIDASMVYGSDQQHADSLRTFTDGLLLTTGGGLFLPMNKDGSMFIAGDIRVTEQVGLATMHTLFVREHNRIATEIKNDNPGFADELIYQLARKKVYAIVEAITYNEWLPALMGPDNPISTYSGYNPAASPNISNEFSTGVFRLGHTLLNNQLRRLNDDGTSIAAGPIQLRDAFFNPSALLDFGIEPYLKGLATQQAQELDARVIHAVRNFLFENINGPAMGFDLVALNIQRGRDHGLPDFNTLRIAFGLPPINSFAELTSDPVLRAQLASVYPTVDDMDPWIGVIAEDHASNSSLGATAITVLKDQFERVRDADRFWYELVFSGDELVEIQNTTLKDVILRNTTLTNLNDNVFFVPGG